MIFFFFLTCLSFAFTLLYLHPSISIVIVTVLLQHSSCVPGIKDQVYGTKIKVTNI